MAKAGGRPGGIGAGAKRMGGPGKKPPIPMPMMPPMGAGSAGGAPMPPPGAAGFKKGGKVKKK